MTLTLRTDDPHVVDRAAQLAATYETTGVAMLEYSSHSTLTGTLFDVLTVRDGRHVLWLDRVYNTHASHTLSDALLEAWYEHARGELNAYLAWRNEALWL